MNITLLQSWLLEHDPVRLGQLWQLADDARGRVVGNAVHLRGLLEISNHCCRRCRYCGINGRRKGIVRYRMNAEEIIASARAAADLGCGTVVMQAGEDYGITRDWLAEVIRAIKSETGLAVTLSMGERPEQDLAAWRKAGADRYLLRFETSNIQLYKRIHLPRKGEPLANRQDILMMLRNLGYEIGTGVMVGLPGQTITDLAGSIALFRDMDIDMIGVGPFIPHPATPLGRYFRQFNPIDGQVANTEEMTCKVVALTRIVCPQANIPSTTALATINRQSGFQTGLCRGANVIMPNVTPGRYRALYEIYPSKVCFGETARQTVDRIHDMLVQNGRHIGTGPGNRIGFVPGAGPGKESAGCS